MSKAIMLNPLGGNCSSKFVLTLENNLMRTSPSVVDYYEDFLNVDKSRKRAFYFSADNNVGSHAGNFLLVARGGNQFGTFDVGVSYRDGASVIYAYNYDWFIYAGATLTIILSYLD